MTPEEKTKALFNLSCLQLQVARAKLPSYLALTFALDPLLTPAHIDRINKLLKIETLLMEALDLLQDLDTDEEPSTPPE